MVLPNNINQGVYHMDVIILIPIAFVAGILNAYDKFVMISVSFQH